jgi:hypothetical protein
MGNFIRPLYTDIQGAIEKLTSNSSSIQTVNYSGSIMEIYTFENQKVKCDIIFNNVLNPSGTLTLSLLNFSSQVAVKTMDFLYCDNISITSINTNSITFNTDKLISLNGLIQIEGY